MQTSAQSNPASRLTELRAAMRAQRIDALIVPSADPHLSEYLPPRWQGREWLSGFTGSVGTLVVTQDFAGVWIRYSDIGQSEVGLLCRHLVRAEIKNTTENNITSLKIICTICDTRTGKKVSEITLPKQGGSPITIKGKTSASILFGVNYQSDWTYQHEKSSGSEACSFEIGDIVLTR